MRLLYLTIDGLPTFRPDVAALWGKYLPREGCAADIVAVRGREIPRAAVLWPSGRALTVARRRHALVTGLIDFLHDCACLIAMAPGRYVAVQVRDKTFIALVALLVARARGLPFFYWMSFPYGASLRQLARTAAVRRNLPQRLYLWWRGGVGDWVLQRVVLPRADHVFVQSERMAEEVVRGGVDRARVTAVPMGVDPDRFPDVLPRSGVAGVPTGARVIGYLGECSRVRRIDFLVTAVARARRTLPSVYLLIVGDAILPEEQAWLRHCVAAAGLADRCVITGWLPPDEATAALAGAEICAALMAPDPILDSTSPTKLVEYLAMGRPVIANDHPEQTRVIEASEAGIVVRYDVDAFAHGIVALLGRQDEHAGMAERGRGWVLRERGYPRIAAELAARYRVLLGGGGSSPGAQAAADGDGRFLDAGVAKPRGA